MKKYISMPKLPKKWTASLKLRHFGGEVVIYNSKDKEVYALKLPDKLFRAIVDFGNHQYDSGANDKAEEINKMLGGII